MAATIGSGLESYLHQHAREQALNRIVEAKEEAERIASQTAEEVAKLRRSSEERTAQAIADRRRRSLAQARLKARQTIGRRQEELLDRVWRAAARRLQEPMEPAARLSLLKKLIIDAAEQLGGGALELHVNAQDQRFFTPGALDETQAMLKQAYNIASLELMPEPIRAWGGAIVLGRDAHQLANNTLEERLALTQRYLRDDVYRLLARAARAEDNCEPGSKVG